MISICVATRHRPTEFKRLCLTALNLSDNPDNIEFISYHDADDTSTYEYVGNHKEITGERNIGIFKMANECQKIATGPIYMYTADDFYFETKGWDTEVMKVFDRYDDKIVLVCPDGRWWKNWRIGVIGFVHQNWVDTLGYLLPPYDGGQAADRWLNELATSVNRRVRLLSVVMGHSNTKDTVHHEKNRQCRRERWTAKYYEPECSAIRLEDIKKLKIFIDNFHTSGRLCAVE